jgi:hypothetical protein
MKRADILATASEYVTTDRAATHGNAEDNFLRTAELWNAYLGVDNITSIDVAVMLALLKVARIRSKPKKCRQLDRHRRLCRLRWRDSDRRLKND